MLPYKVGPEPIVIHEVTWAPYKWPKINWFHWGYFTLLIGAPCHSDLYITGNAAHLV